MTNKVADVIAGIAITLFVLSFMNFGQGAQYTMWNVIATLGKAVQ